MFTFRGAWTPSRVIVRARACLPVARPVCRKISQRCQVFTLAFWRSWVRDKRSATHGLAHTQNARTTLKIIRHTYEQVNTCLIWLRDNLHEVSTKIYCYCRRERCGEGGAPEMSSHLKIKLWASWYIIFVTFPSTWNCSPAKHSSGLN